MSFTDLLRSAPTGTDHAVQKYFPEGLYLAKIKDADIYHRFWGVGDGSKRQVPTAFECYAARFRIVDVFQTKDDDKDAHIRAQLDAFGDWQGYEPPAGYRKMAIPTIGPDKVLAIAGIGDAATFPLIETNENFSQFIAFADEFPRFIEVRQDGTLGGFVSKLSQRPDAMVPIELPENPAEAASLMATVAATIDAYAVIEIITESSTGKDGIERKSTKVHTVTSVA
jgi:hypothetical protein